MSSGRLLVHGVGGKAPHVFYCSNRLPLIRVKGRPVGPSFFGSCLIASVSPWWETERLKGTLGEVLEDQRCHLTISQTESSGIWHYNGVFRRFNCCFLPFFFGFVIPNWTDPKPWLNPWFNPWLESNQLGSYRDLITGLLRKLRLHITD